MTDGRIHTGWRTVGASKNEEPRPRDHNGVAT